MADVISEDGMPILFDDEVEEQEEEEIVAVQMQEIYGEAEQPMETVPQYEGQQDEILQHSEMQFSVPQDTMPQNEALQTIMPDSLQLDEAVLEIKQCISKLEEIQQSIHNLEEIRKNTTQLEEIRESTKKLEDRIGVMESQLKQMFSDGRKGQQSQSAVQAQTKLLVDRVSEINDRLHAENQKLKNDLYSEMIKPVLLEFCGIGTELSKDINRNKNKGNTKEAQALQDFRDMIVHTALEHVGVEVYEPEVGQDFDAKRHKAVKLLPVEDASQHRKIESVVNQGYLWNKNGQIQVLVPCRVNVYNKENDSEQQP